MSRLVLVDAPIAPGEDERFVLSLPAHEAGLFVLIDGEPTAAMIEHLGSKLASIHDRVPPSGAREKQLLAETKEVVRDAMESAPWKAYDLRLRENGLPTLEDSALEMRFVGFFPAVTRVAEIGSQLTSRSWERVEIFTTWGEMAAAFRIAAEIEGFEVSTIERKSLAGRTRLRRFRKRAGRVLRRWIDVPLLLLQFLYFRLRRAGSPFSLPESSADGVYLFQIRPMEVSLYVASLAPVIQRAGSEHRALPLVGWRNRGAVSASQAGFEVCHPSRFFGVGDYLGVIADLFRIKRAWDASQGSEIRETIRYRGVSLWPLIDWTLERHWFRHLFWLNVWQRALKKLLASGAVRGVVQAEDFSALAALTVRLARAAGKPSFYLQPALISDSKRFDTLTADHGLLLDEYSRGIYLDRGVVAERLHVVGFTRCEGLAERIPSAPPERIRKRFHVSPEQPFVFFVGGRGPLAEKTALIVAVLDIVKAVPDVHICIKPHPSDTDSSYTDFYPDYPEGVFSLFPPDLDMHDLILAADLTVTAFSNVAVEAAILDRPVLAVNLRGEADVIPFEPQGIAMAARSPEEVRTRAAHFFGDPSFRAELKAARDRYFERNPQYRRPDVAGRILDKLDELTEDREESSCGSPHPAARDQ